ncbi:CPBP family intramembrane glutamic endopeptidase [Ideonella oryzae]|uniref:CPBP family intramembrane metalloprotease n=1 Tax=Ideonella oryzae TaxID=2937441 RepID=A0ABT1BGX5_9BURK|nr:CPBP family intramembrane metalloprotease [Ideonella oryzae]
MKLSLHNERRHVRDGWKAALFVLAAMACFAVVGLIGHRLPQALKPFAPSAILIAVLGIGITRGATWLESESLASVGLKLDRRFLAQFAGGMLIGVALIAAAAVAVCAFAGVRLTATAAPALQVELKLAVMFLGGAIFEELLFRGYAFQRAARGMGTWPAILVFGVLFCLGHLPGNLDVGWPLLSLAMANLFAGAVLQSLLYVRTHSLAMPIGLHFGWNLLQESLGFGVSGLSSPHAWFHVDLGSQPAWLTGGNFGLEASAWALAVVMLAVAASGRSRQGPLLADSHHSA